MTEANTLDKSQNDIKPFVKPLGAMRKHTFNFENRCEFCGVRRENVEDNVMHATCFVAERKDALHSGEYATRVGTVYMRSKAHLSDTMRAHVMEAIATVLRANANSASGAAGFSFRVVDGTTLVIELDAEPG